MDNAQQKVLQALLAQKKILYPPSLPPRTELSTLLGYPDPNPQAIPAPPPNEWSWLLGGDKTPPAILPPGTPYNYTFGTYGR